MIIMAVVFSPLRGLFFPHLTYFLHPSLFLFCFRLPSPWWVQPYLWIRIHSLRLKMPELLLISHSDSEYPYQDSANLIRHPEPYSEAVISHKIIFICLSCTFLSVSEQQPFGAPFSVDAMRLFKVCNIFIFGIQLSFFLS